jgi:hypothetical protein
MNGKEVNNFREYPKLTNEEARKIIANMQKERGLSKKNC